MYELQAICFTRFLGKGVKQTTVIVFVPCIVHGILICRRTQLQYLPQISTKIKPISGDQHVDKKAHFDFGSFHRQEAREGGKK